MEYFYCICFSPTPPLFSQWAAVSLSEVCLESQGGFGVYPRQEDFQESPG